MCTYCGFRISQALFAKFDNKYDDSNMKKNSYENIDIICT